MSQPNESDVNEAEARRVGELLPLLLRLRRSMSLNLLAGGWCIRVEVEPDAPSRHRTCAKQPAQEEEPLTSDGERLSLGCSRAILTVLGEVGCRLTLTQINEEFSKRGIPWSATTIAHTAATMRRRGLLTNRKKSDERGRGYGLPS